MVKKTTPVGTSAADAKRHHAEETTKMQASKITVFGVEHSVGDVISVQGQEFTLVCEKHLHTSNRSGVTAGTYPVGTVRVQPGGRVAYRAIVGNEIYPVRRYGTPEETIAKMRGRDSRSRRGSSDAHDSGDISLTSSADKILSEYLSFKTNLDGGDVLSGLIETHLKPELVTIRAQEEAIRRLPKDLLAGLVGADEDTRRRIREMLGVTGI